jgi:histidine triad (HIT) family protein
VAENERFFAFLDIAPLAKGHTLVIPKREVDYFYDLEDDELQEMIVFAKQIAKKIKATTECKKVATVVLGLEVAHAHIHLVPMSTEKDVDFSREKLSLSPEEFAKIAESLQ